jgi:mono/diheme cytochrome c family protein
VTVEFRGQTEARWEVAPERRAVTVSRGEVFEALVRVRNTSDHEAFAMVRVEIAPPEAAGFLVHLGCGPTFSLILKPGESVAVPAAYFLGDWAPAEIGAVGLAYAVYSFEALGPDPLRVGGSIYGMRCVSCHGRQGRGDGPIARFLEGGVGDLAPALRQKADRRLIKAIGEGMGPMPAFAPALTAAEQRALVLYLRSLAPGGP